MQELRLLFINNVPFVGGNIGDSYLHGDSTYMEFPDGTNALLDAGTSVSGPHIAEKLLSMGVKRLDRFILSHPHADHGDGFAAVAEAMPVGEMIWSGCDVENQTYAPAACAVAEKYNIPRRTVRAGEKLSLGGTEVEVLHPGVDATSADPAAERSVQGDHLNNNSLVLRLTYGDFSVLFAGDVHKDMESCLVEKYGARLQSTLLKIPHHGNDTSMGEVFFDCVKPQLGVSLGRRCIGRIWIMFTEAKTPLYATYADGDILAVADGSRLQVSCDKGKRIFELE